MVAIEFPVGLAEAYKHENHIDNHQQQSKEAHVDIVYNPMDVPLPKPSSRYQGMTVSWPCKSRSREFT